MWFEDQEEWWRNAYTPLYSPKKNNEDHEDQDGKNLAW